MSTETCPFQLLGQSGFVLIRPIEWLSVRIQSLMEPALLLMMRLCWWCVRRIMLSWWLHHYWGGAQQLHVCDQAHHQYPNLRIFGHVQPPFAGREMTLLSLQWGPNSLRFLVKETGSVNLDCSLLKWVTAGSFSSLWSINYVIIDLNPNVINALKRQRFIRFYAWPFCNLQEIDLTAMNYLKKLWLSNMVQ